jgi:hypothetical protein
MNSPLTGKPMVIGTDTQTVTINGHDYLVPVEFWKDVDHGAQFTTEEQNNRMVIELSKQIAEAKSDGHLCDVRGCYELATCGGFAWADTGYWMLCDKHFSIGLKGSTQPQMDAEAIKREARRGKNGVLG